jgi:hypothetical protein
MSWCVQTGVNIASAGLTKLVSSRVTPPPQLHFSSRLHNCALILATRSGPSHAYTVK